MHTKLGAELEADDVLIGNSGGQSVIHSTDFGNVYLGLVSIETEHGLLFIDPEGEFQVL